jgi:hypothetical protein
MKFELKIDPWNTRDKVLLADVQRVASELGKDSVTEREYREHGQYGMDAMRRRFGSWSKIIDASGLQKSNFPGFTDLEYYENLAEVWEKLGRQPGYADMRKPLSKHVIGSFVKRFGTWRKTLTAFESYLNAEVDCETQIERTIASLEHRSQPTPARTPRDVDARLRFLVLRRDHFKCLRCGKSPATDSNVLLEVAHILAWSNGGETILENLQTLCSVCNSGKSNLDASDS